MNHDAYLYALEYLYRTVEDEDEAHIWGQRWNRFKVGYWDRTAWLTWVEANAENIPWCRQLVVTAVEQQILR